MVTLIQNEYLNLQIFLLGVYHSLRIQITLIEHTINELMNFSQISVIKIVLLLQIRHNVISFKGNNFYVTSKTPVTTMKTIQSTGQ